MGFSTDAVHAGQSPDAVTGAVITPLYQTSTFAQEGPGQHKGYEYGRTQNPTRQAFEKNVAVLESGQFGFAFASGMAAISTVAQLLQAGDHLIATENVYGGTYRFFEKVMAKFGLGATWVDTSELERLRASFRPQTRMVFVETPTNPMLTLSDIEAIAGLCREHDVLLVVDNTFLSPYFQRPLELGADLVLHSTTKYLNGHSDVIGGVIATRRADLAEQLAFLQNAVGAVPSPFDCWLALRATKTLALRMQAHGKNALRVAEYLAGAPGVQSVHYPHLPSHPQFALAQKQHKTSYGNSGSGGMVTFTVENFERADTIMRKFKLFTVAESLGGVESLVCHPATMTHASVPSEMRRKIGIADGLIRLSVGVEDADDLTADLEQALSG